MSKIMFRDFLREWIDVLESGKYKHTRSFLVRDVSVISMMYADGTGEMKRTGPPDICYCAQGAFLKSRGYEHTDSPVPCFKHKGTSAYFSMSYFVSAPREDIFFINFLQQVESLNDKTADYIGVLTYLKETLLTGRDFEVEIL